MGKREKILNGLNTIVESLPLSGLTAMHNLVALFQRTLTDPDATYQRRWAFLLTSVGALSSIVYPHAPLVAVGAVSGATLRTRLALQVALLVWLVNQLYGFIWRSYPQTFESFTWGVTMGIGTALVTLLACLISGLDSVTHRGVKIVIATLTGFAVFEGIILSLGFWLIGTHVLTWSILGRLLFKEIIWTLGLTLVHFIFARFMLRGQQRNLTPGNQ